jgi:hypothetical protein
MMSRKFTVLAAVLAGAMLAPAAMAQPMYWHHHHRDWYRHHGYDWDGHRWHRHHHHY